MKKTIIAILQLQLVTPTLLAAVPLRWTVETSRVQPAVFEAYQGETLTFEAALQSHGKPLAAPVNYSFFWQTNGMGSTYWEVKVRGEGEQRNNSTVHLDPSPSPTNVLFATWSPEMDVGAKVYNCFIGSPSNIYHAAFQLRLRPSPGALPNALPLPTPVIDFARVRVLNPPWGSGGGGGGGCDTNAVDILANAAVVTNALTVATTNRIAALETATNNLSSSVSGLASSVSDLSSSVSSLESSKADKTTPYYAGNLAALTADGNLSDSGKKASDFAPAVDGGYLPLRGGTMTGNLRLHGEEGEDFFFEVMIGGEYGGYSTRYLHGKIIMNVPGGGELYFPEGSGTLALTSDISATNPTFSNAVLAVGLNIDTNSVAVLNEIASTFGGFPLGAGETATTVGGLLAALAAAAAWLKKNKVGSFAPVGGASATVDNGVAKLDDFFTNSNSLLTGTIDEEVISKGTAPDAHLEVPTDTDDRLKLILADNSVAYDSAKALPYKLTSVIGDRVVATMTLTAASTDITLPTISASDTTVKDFILDVTNAYAVEGVATDAGINIPRTDFKLVTRDGESLTDVTTVKAGKSAFICFTQKSPVVVDGTTYPCWCVIQLPFGDPS